MVDKNEIRNLIAKIIEMDPDKIDENAHFIKDYGMDSLIMLEILATLEQKYNVRIPQEKLMDMVTLKGVISVFQDISKEAEINPA